MACSCEKRDGKNDDLTAGSLVRLFPAMQQASELAYYIVYRSECATLPKLAAFREWLMREAGAAN